MATKNDSKSGGMTKDLNPCIWMQAGVAKKKSCNNYYDCTTCKYDLGMKKKADSGKQISWQDAMRKREGLDRVCRHSLTNRIMNRACAYNYQCSDCDFDQFFEEVWAARNAVTPSNMDHIKGFNMPKNYCFHNGHTWAKVESGGYIRIGMDDFALKLLGNADGFDLPLMGKELNLGDIGWGMKRKDNLADIMSPVGGVIVEVNSDAREKPALVNHEPYGEGWLFMVHTSDIKGSIKQLMADDDSRVWMNDEVNILEDMIEDVAGPMATDGGLFSDDIYGKLPGLDWEKLTKTFLKT
ncbi:MAG: hypothetical protein HOD17_08370 [Desulfobacteraceae bacterium]|nr:hypothetical protein [Desulfobacteraceae bacterium]